MLDKKSICHRLLPDIRHLCLCLYLRLYLYLLNSTSEVKFSAKKCVQYSPMQCCCCVVCTRSYEMCTAVHAETWQRRKIYILFSAKTAKSGSTKSFTPTPPAP